MAATMRIRFVPKFFTSLKQQNLFKVQSKWSEFFKSSSCVLGCIKIFMMHFLHFVCIKMHDFCVTQSLQGLCYWGHTTDNAHKILVTEVFFTYVYCYALSSSFTMGFALSCESKVQAHRRLKKWKSQNISSGK